MITDFEEYIRQSEPHKREKSYAWQTAIGLQAVDGLRLLIICVKLLASILRVTSRLREVKQLVNSYYESKSARKGGREWNGRG